MSNPKYKAGDLVDVRGEYEISAALVTSHEYHEDGSDVNSPDGEECSAYEGFYYYTDSSHLGFHESIVFPHNKPGDSFDEIIKELNKPIKKNQPEKTT